MTVVYGPNERGLHTKFWKKLTIIRNNYNDLWILGENFNITRFASEKKGKDRSRKDRQEFNKFISQLDLKDLPLSDQLFT